MPARQFSARKLSSSPICSAKPCEVLPDSATSFQIRLCAEVAERGFEPARHVGAGVEVVIGDQGTEVVRAECNEDGVDELARPSRPVDRLIQVIR